MNENQNETSVLSQTNLLGLGTNLALDHVLPLLLLANRVSKLQNFSQSEMANLREKLINDILSTTSKISNLGIYEEDDIIRLRYCLCVFIDESLLKNEIFMNSFWANNTLTTRFFNENLGGNKFFGIMDKWFENVGKNKDFLEFIYACLVLGYKGKYETQEDCNEKISYLCENIAAAVSPLIKADENVFEKSYLKQTKKSFLEVFSLKRLKFYFILLAIAMIAAAFLYSTYSMDQNNIRNDSILNNKIENFMDNK
ncbi:type IVB secretion system protein IcmH/DotU [Campylobacter concisus]|uniref:type IVB secretion system protein IcmH/DotU n=3 Tax=Campylobacter concisus TaxID=199 RepID=UPI000A074F85|nr:type IVB secretion system protein IcmH/DotU [Campylobacter concisus]RKV89276.1 MAG: DotU family type IV/VI secretion system protein [Campylobacter sp.]MBE9819075.1 DotU family type IV/VI secretion system protein [Campylobacter concisus]ORI00480.1 glutamyl-tRNA amidotransferase [Campylobacter concisus]OUT07290.1 glutamyl-tRNA amidotransferase [Campylobacter concisus]OUT13823.1 glutamyl-tRNA amidotransferase [Campylobacter concisus]